MSSAGTLLVTLTGRDRPGVTARLFGTLTAHDLRVIDVEQVVIRGVLVLGVLLDVGATNEADLDRLRRDVQSAAADLDMQLDVSPGHGEDDPRRRGRLHVTLLAEPMGASGVSAVASALAAEGANIDRIVRLARHPVTCLEFEVSGADPETLRPRLAQVAAEAAVDIAVQASGLLRRSKRLVVIDVDSTLIQGEVIEMLAERAGHRDEVAALTDAAMSGHLDFAASLRRRVRLLAGLDEAAVDDVRRSIQLTPGARTLVRTLQRLDHGVGIVSGGFSQVVAPLAAELGVSSWAANTLEVADGRLTGELVGPILDRAGKAAALRLFAAEAGVALEQTVAIGDGANDLDMLTAAGLGVAFNAKAVVRAAADTALRVPFLDVILYLLGIPSEEVDAAGTTPAQAATRVLSPPAAPEQGDGAKMSAALPPPPGGST